MNGGEVQRILKYIDVPIIIFGAGIVGEVLFHACSQANIVVKCYCDNNIHKAGTYLNNTNVLHSSEVKILYPDAVFLIAVADIKDVVEQLNHMGYTKWYPSIAILSDFDFKHVKLSESLDFVEYAINTCLLCQNSYFNPEKLFFRSVDIIITERCSMKCKDCSNLMQYYREPVNCDLAEIFRSIDKFCDFMDQINEFRVIGGEPFMHSEFHQVIKKLDEEPKVHRIVIYTNGTIVPSPIQIDYLQSPKVLLIITDYGKLSKKMNHLTQLLQEKSISFLVRKVQGWTDCSSIEPHQRSMAQQRKVFRDCCAKNLVTLSNGKLYRCPFAANAARLQAVPNFEEDYIDFWDEKLEKMDIIEAKNRIRNFLVEKEYLETCDYCNGRPFDAPEILPAIQTSRILDYKKYKQD